jgi:hypothetical protein
MTDWGLRGRYFRRFVMAVIILSTTTAAILDDSCCCCDCSGWNEAMHPGIDTVDPMAQERIRSSTVVREAVGEVTTITMSPFGVTELVMQQTFETVYKISYNVVGATATILFYVYAVERAGSWVIEAIESSDGAHVDGTVPSTSYPSSGGGGGGWD